MRIRRYLIIIAVTCIFVALALPIAKLIDFFFFVSIVDTPAIASDGNGGALIVYEVEAGNDCGKVYVRRIATDGSALFVDGDVLIHTGEHSGIVQTGVVTDGRGGAVIHRYGEATKLDAQGNILWQRDNHLEYDSIIGDAGDVLTPHRTYSENESMYKASVVKTNQEGTFVWGEAGVDIPFSTNVMRINLIGDDGGGAVVVIQDKSKQIIAQRIDQGGNISWRHDGVKVFATPNGIAPDRPIITSDGMGGAIIAWSQWPEQTVVGNISESYPSDILVQRIDVDGNIMWQKDGVALGFGAAGGMWAHNPKIVSDGSGGAIIVCEDIGNSGIGLYAQMVDAEGNVSWPEGGITVCQLQTHQSIMFEITEDGFGGCIIVWDYKDEDGTQKPLRVQRLNSDGEPLWDGNGVQVSVDIDKFCAYPTVSEDNLGGALIAWSTGKYFNRPEQSYIQRIDAEGNRAWEENGILLKP
ncbi:MAG: hypothetical protein U9N44_04535 [Chloroflexota bacterium]|nr:hypothetical protein [Chloroflexota bacterium]